MAEPRGRMLVVDDDVISRKLLVSNLKAEGHEVEIAESGQTALDMMRTQSFDMVLLDLLMPDLDGFQVLAHMKSEPDLSNILVIVVSAMEDMESVVRCIKMGATDYLYKPFDPIMLRARINALLETKRLHDLEQAYLKQLQEERSRLQAVIASSYDGLVLIDRNAIVRVVNNQAIHIMGLPGDTDEWLGRSAGIAVLEIRKTDRTFAKRVLVELHRVEQSDNLPREGDYVTASVAIHWMSLPVASAGNQLGRLIVLRDISETYLVQKMRDDLVRTLVHDLRNPLTSIMVSLEMLGMDKKNPLQPLQQDMLNISRANSVRMADMVNSILDFNRLESGQVPINPCPVSISGVAAEIVNLQAPLVLEKKIMLENSISPNLPFVWADSSLIGRVFQNLIGNAVKFTPEGGRIGLEATVKDHTLLVSVSDSGPGVPEDLKGRLFNLFVSGQTEGHGTGLGLAYCRLAIEAHGGNIWLESEPGKGSTFKFTLPLAPAT